MFSASRPMSLEQCRVPGVFGVEPFLMRSADLRSLQFAADDQAHLKTELMAPQLAGRELADYRLSASSREEIAALDRLAVPITPQGDFDMVRTVARSRGCAGEADSRTW